jgi:hypothetical protein
MVQCGEGQRQIQSMSVVEMVAIATVTLDTTYLVAIGDMVDAQRQAVQCGYRTARNSATPPWHRMLGHPTGY